MPHHSPLLSIIVPVYNTSSYLRECVDSLLAQSLDDLEIVAVDDGSTDDSPRILAEYATAYPGRFRLLTKANGGLADARNHGIAAATGEYVGFVDADDYVSPKMFSLMCDRASTTGADIVVCKMMGFDPESGAEFPYEEAPSEAFAASLSESPSLLVKNSPSVCNKIFRRKLFTEHDLHFPVGLAFEDLATTYSLFAHANRMEKVDEFLYFYRRARGGSIMSTFGAHYEELMCALEIAYERFSADEVFDRYRDQLEAVALEHLILGRYADFFLHAPAAVKSAYIDRVFKHLDRHFPEWEGGPVLRSMCTSWWLRIISAHRLLLKLYTALPARVALSLSWRLRMFANGRA